MRNKQKTPRGDGSRTGFKSLHRGEIRQEDDSKTSHAPQGKCARCPYFPGRGYACNVPCPFTVRGACAACVHFLPVNEHRNKARCLWTGERLDAGEVQWVRECIGFEERHFSASDLYPQNPQYPQNCLSEKKTGEGLTSAGVSGKVVFPNLERRHKRLSSLPKAGKSLVRISAVEAPIMSNGRLSHIGRVATSSIREGWRLLKSRGELHPAFSFNPRILEVPHV